MKKLNKKFKSKLINRLGSTKAKTVDVLVEALATAGITGAKGELTQETVYPELNNIKVESDRAAIKTIFSTKHGVAAKLKSLTIKTPAQVAGYINRYL